MKTQWVLLALAVPVVGCTTAQTQIVEVTREVPVTVEVTREVVLTRLAPVEVTVFVTASHTPAPTSTSTPTPTEIPPFTARELAGTATAEYRAKLAQYTLVEKADFLNHPWEYVGQRIILRGEVYDIEDQGHTVQFWVSTGATSDFVGVYLLSPLGSGDGVSEGYLYYAYGTVRTDREWSIGYGLYDAFVGKTLP